MRGDGGVEVGDVQSRPVLVPNVKSLKDELFQVSARVETRKDQVAKLLIAMEEAMVSGSDDEPDSTGWIDMELAEVDGKIGQLETLETRLWELTARFAGDESRLKQARGWRQWLC